MFNLNGYYDILRQSNADMSDITLRTLISVDLFRFSAKCKIKVSVLEVPQ